MHRLAQDIYLGSTYIPRGAYISVVSEAKLMGTYPREIKRGLLKITEGLNLLLELYNEYEKMNNSEIAKAFVTLKEKIADSFFNDLYLSVEQWGEVKRQKSKSTTEDIETTLHPLIAEVDKWYNYLKAHLKKLELDMKSTSKEEATEKEVETGIKIIHAIIDKVEKLLETAEKDF